MSPIRPVVVLELNELCPPLIERFIDAGDLPNFARLRSSSVVCTTEAEESQGHLNPWIQWVTVHAGLGFDDHGVFKLGEGARLVVPTVADVVTAAGGDVWLCSPMNVVPRSAVRGAWLPDPWNPDASPVPRELEPFRRFVQTNVQEHTNAARKLTPRDAARFVSFMMRHGLSRHTIAATARQLVGERIGRVPRWQRAALLDHYQWDVFRSYHRRLRPTFATYFSNTTAHYQHLYWRYMDPEPFTIKPTAEERRRFGDAVRFGYRKMDRLVGQALHLVGDAATLVLCTAISQQPYVAAEESGGSRFHRPYNIADFVRRLGVDGVTNVSPVMASQFHLFHATEDEAAATERLLRSAVVGDRPAFDVRRVGADVFAGCAIVDEVEPIAEIVVRHTGLRVPFHLHLYRSQTAKSGYHNSQGAFWIREPGGRPHVVDEPVPLRSVAPTLLGLMGIDPPATMSAAPLPVG